MNQNQLLAIKLRNVPEGATACFSRVSLFISSIFYNTRGVDPGRAEGICYGTGSSFVQPKAILLPKTTLARKYRHFCCAAMGLAVDSAIVAKFKELCFLMH